MPGRSETGRDRAEEEGDATDRRTHSGRFSGARSSQGRLPWGRGDAVSSSTSLRNPRTGASGTARLAESGWAGPGRPWLGRGRARAGVGVLARRGREPFSGAGVGGVVEGGCFLGSFETNGEPCGVDLGSRPRPV